MKKIIVQLLALVLLFFSVWFALSRVDWVKLFGIKETTLKTEEKLGNLIWDMVKRSEREIKSDSLTAPLDTILRRICAANNIDRSKIKLHLVEKDEVNAFALPDNHLVVYTGLIKAAESDAEVAGVLSHEIAHMQKHHVMRKLVKETGFAVLASITSAKGNSQVAKQLLKLLSSTAYDRTLESEADITGVDYLIKADIDPSALANFLYRLSEKDSEIKDDLSWISTHPDSKERAEKIIDYAKDRHVKNKAILKKEDWEKLKRTADAND